MPDILTRSRPGNHYLLITLDSCRYDSFVRASPRHIPRLGTVERRWSYASWTSPSHYNLLIGLMPHSSPKHVYASEYYKEDLLRFNERFGTTDFKFRSLVPHLFLPVFLSKTLGYRTHAMVSLPVLNPKTPINVGFDSFRLMERHNDLRGMLSHLTFDDERPSFYLMNVGETHYPYALPGEPPEEWPRIHGIHGVFKHLDEHIVGGRLAADDRPFDQKTLDRLRDRQIEAVRYVDGVVEELFDLLPPNTYVTITADHGELFGEEGYFGHGPIQHEKVFEVPFVEGLLR